MNHIYVTNHTYVQFKVAKKRLSGLLMLLLLFFYFLFCVGASFLIIVISQYCGHLSKQEVNYMGVCLCHDLFHCKALYMVHSICLISRELNKVPVSGYIRYVFEMVCSLIETQKKKKREMALYAQEVYTKIEKKIQTCRHTPIK